MAFRLKVLGSPELWGPDGAPIPVPLGKPLGFLVRMACQNKDQSREELTVLLWPDMPRPKARHSLRQAMWVLKNLVGENLIEGDDLLSLRDDALTTDLSEFRDALAEGRIRDARQLWRGPFLEGLAFPGLRHWDHWVEDIRTDLERRYQQALLHSAQESLQNGDPEEALAELEAAIVVNPTNEQAHEIRIGLLIDLLRFDAAREALTDAYGFIGDEPSSRNNLRGLENRLADVVRRGRTLLDRSAGLPLEFVGRSRELAALRGHWGRACAGHPGVVVITGPAGIGKTRLGQEFATGVPGEDARTVLVRGTRAEMKLRWGAAATLVRQLLLLPGSAGISPSSDSLLKAMIPSLGRDGVTLQTVNGVSPAALLDATTDLLEAVSFEAPLLILLDDFQWVDRDSRTLLLSLMARGGESRSLTIVLGRPDLSSRSWKELEEILTGEQGAPLLTLQPLQLEEVQELLGLMVAFADGDEADGMAKRIHEVSGGNPLFIKGLIQELQDQGVIEEGEDGWEAHAQDLPLQFTFPETIKALMAERLDRLSPTATTVARALAAMGRSAALPELQKVANLEEATLTQGISELLEREVVIWTEDDHLEFSHFLLREAAADHLPHLPSTSFPRPWWRNRRSLLGIAAGIILSLPLALLWGGGFFAAGSSSSPLPYGGGSLMILQQDQLLGELRVTHAPPSSWEPTLPLGAIPPGTRKIYRIPGDSLLFFGFNSDSAGPDVFQVLPDGSRKPVMGGPGDQMIFDLSPDGTTLLVGSENLQATDFARNIYKLGVEGGEPRLLYEGHGADGPAFWSPDGDLIAFRIEAAEDTLALISSQGKRIGSLPVGEFRALEWCGSDLYVVARGLERQHLLRVHVPEMTADTLENLPLGTSLTCSPDGSALALRAIRGGKAFWVVREIETGEMLPLRTEGFEDAGLSWIPDHAPSVPIRLEIGEDSLTIGWGERRGLTSFLLFSDGSRDAGEIRWESMEPSIATVDAENTLTGNGVGTTGVVASWGYSFSDTLQVEVLDSGGGGAFLRDQFSELDTITWIPVGRTPFVAIRDGEHVLLMPGDEKYMDGLVSRDPIPAEQGVTVELEFRIERTRAVHQSIDLCLRDTEITEAGIRSAEIQGIGQDICVGYPARELEKLDPTEFSLTLIPGVESFYRLPEVPSGRDWIHLGLQIRADGEVSLIVNREKVAVSPLRVSTTPRAHWHLILDGRAVETELQIRNLTVWREPRY